MKKLIYANGNTKYKRKNGSKRKAGDHVVMIINQASAHSCTSRKLGFCQLPDIKNCYAYQAEARYPECLPYRNRQAAQWKRSGSYDMSDMIKEVQDKKRLKFTHLRFAESGDFTRRWDILKLSIISQEIKNQCNMDTFVYTARKDLIDDRMLDMISNKSLVINGSGFMVHNEYRIVPEGYKPKHKKEVWCKNNCYKCRLCKVRGGFTILANERTDKTKAATREANRVERISIRQSIV